MKRIAVWLAAALLVALAGGSAAGDGSVDTAKNVALRLLAPGVGSTDRARLMFVAECLAAGHPRQACWRDPAALDGFKALVAIQVRQDRNQFIDRLEEHLRIEIDEIVAGMEAASKRR